MKKAKTPKQGGARIGAGRKAKFGEETVRLGFRVPKSQVKAIKNLVNGYLETIPGPGDNIPAPGGKALDPSAQQARTEKVRARLTEFSKQNNF